MTDTVVVVEYASESDRDAGQALRREPFVGFLRRTRAGPVAVGDEWTEVVNDGCGTTTDVTLTVVGVRGGDSVGEGTRFEFTPVSFRRGERGRDGP